MEKRRRTRPAEPKKLRVLSSSSVEVSVKPSFGPGFEASLGFPKADEEAILTCCVNGAYLGKLDARHCHRLVDARTWEQHVPPAVMACLREVLGHQLSMAPRFAMGLDGTKYAVKIHAGFNAVEYKWWARTPPGWEPLAGLVRELAAIARVSEVLQREWPWAD